MDFARIKNLVKRNGDKLILMENGEPEAVVMSFNEYARMAANGSGGESVHPAQEKFDVPTRLAAWEAPDASETEFVTAEEGVASEPLRCLRLEDIRLEDLPI